MDIIIGIVIGIDVTPAGTSRLATVSGSCSASTPASTPALTPASAWSCGRSTRLKPYLSCYVPQGLGNEFLFLIQVCVFGNTSLASSPVLTTEKVN